MGEKSQNNVRALREAQLMSKAELARKAGLSPLTIDRVESGKPCRMDTKRKLILALGLKLADRHKVFPEDAPPPEPRSKRQRTREEEGRPAPADTEAEPAAGSGGTASGESEDRASQGGEGESPSGEGRGGGSGRGAKSA